MTSFSETLVWIIALASILCVLLRPRGIAEAWWACGGAVVLVALRFLTPAQAGHAVLKGLDVYLFLAGMMILSELAREEGVFDWMAELAAAHAAGSARRLFALVYSCGIVVTVFLSNDATAVVLTPAVLTIVRRLKIDPVPYLLSCAMVANAASFVLPISNPANLVVFDSHVPPLAHWLHSFLAPSVAAVLVTYAVLRIISRKRLRASITEKLTQSKLSRKGWLAVGGLIFTAAALITASALGWNLGAPTCAAAVLVTALVSFGDKHAPRNILKGVSWSVLPLVAGLFVILDALQKNGALRLAVEGLRAAAKMAAPVNDMAAAFGVGLLTNIMNNLPVGLIGGSALAPAQAPGHIANAVLIGVDLGPNLSVAGSLATILWLIVLRREKVKITGWQFFKVGLIAMPAALFAAMLFSRHGS